MNQTKKEAYESQIKMYEYLINESEKLIVKHKSTDSYKKSGKKSIIQSSIEQCQEKIRKHQLQIKYFQLKIKDCA
jgi:type IV secretory pathway VirB4 component